MRRQPINRYIPGDYLRDCDVCGWTYLRSELKKRYDGYIVCDKDYETRHPRDLAEKKIHKDKPFKGD